MTAGNAVALLADLEASLRPVQVESNRAWWEANVRSSPEAERQRQKLELAEREILGDPSAFAAVRAAVADASSPAVTRPLQLLEAAMTPHQLDRETRRRLVELETTIETTYNTHRGEIDGEPVNDNRIAEVLTESDDVRLRREAWEASKSVGMAVAPQLLELVSLRNRAARSVGFRDHYEMALRLGELDERRLFATLDELEAATRGPFAVWKASLDAARTARFGCTPQDLRPWHYDDVFFQEPPRDGRLDLDALFASADLGELTLRTFAAISIDLRPVIEASDLLPRDGKSQHAFCIDIDRQGDVRVLSNNSPNERWMGTMLHEFGHAAYDREIDSALGWFLHGPAHMLTTEAVAMLFGRLVRDAGWLEQVAGLPEPEIAGIRAATRAAQRAAMLVFTRWVLVMTHFERGLYHAPEADHDTRWWDLVERFQGLRRPDGRHAPDWAAKIHLAVAPAYYQNYLYGELLASQLDAQLTATCGGLVDRPAAGRWLIDRFLSPGMSRRWDHLVAHATGEPLSPRHFVDQFVTGP